MHLLPDTLLSCRVDVNELAHSNTIYVSKPVDGLQRLGVQCFHSKPLLLTAAG